MRAMTNKQVLVLEVLRRDGALKCQEIADTISMETPCPVCEAPQEGFPSVRKCPHCYGRGHLYFGYDKAHVALRQLMLRGLVTRTWMKDEWGDEIPRHIYSAVREPQADPDDPLEKLWAAASIEQAGA